MSAVIVVSARSAWAESVGRAFREDGLDVRLATTGELAIDAFVQTPADALVVELDLPGRDGAATVESIRWAPGGEQALVVLVGLESDPERVRRVALELRGAFGACRRHRRPPEHPRVVGHAGRGAAPHRRGHQAGEPRHTPGCRAARARPAAGGDGGSADAGRAPDGRDAARRPGHGRDGTAPGRRRRRRGPGSGGASPGARRRRPHRGRRGDHLLREDARTPRRAPVYGSAPADLGRGPATHHDRRVAEEGGLLPQRHPPPRAFESGGGVPGASAPAPRPDRPCDPRPLVDEGEGRRGQARRRPGGDGRPPAAGAPGGAGGRARAEAHRPVHLARRTLSFLGADGSPRGDGHPRDVHGGDDPSGRPGDPRAARDAGARGPPGPLPPTATGPSRRPPPRPRARRQGSAGLPRRPHHDPRSAAGQPRPLGRRALAPRRRLPGCDHIPRRAGHRSHPPRRLRHVRSPGGGSPPRHVASRRPVLDGPPGRAR